MGSRNNNALLVPLYQRWKQMPSKGGRAFEWGDFNAFYSWAVAEGFDSNSTLYRIDESKPWGPDNCSLDCNSEFIARWNKTVNRIRAHYGLPLFK